MCGLVGVMGNTVSESAKKAFHNMLYLDTLRGEDSTGVAAISNAFSDKTEIEIFKSIGGPTEFFAEHNKGSRDKNLTYKPVSVYLGHNRFATQGKVTTDNAHPFDFKNLVGAHNGTVSMHSLKGFKGYKDFDVDSQIIFSHLSHEQDIKEVWKEVDGALALSWWDKVSQTLNLIRNSQRPLFFAYTRDKKHLFWASESWMLVIAASRNGLELAEVVESKPNQLYTFGLNLEGGVHHIEEAISPFVVKAPAKQNWGHGGRGWLDYSYGDTDWLPPLKGGGKGCSPKALEGSNLIITEYHEIPNNSSAIGYTPSGELVKILLPVVSQKEVKEKILGNKKKGFYFANRINKSAINEKQFWCYWTDMKFIKLKPGVEVKRLPNNGFSILSPKIKTEFAPWYDKSVFLTRAAYEQRVFEGCQCCSMTPKWEDREDLMWADKENFFCKDCKDLPYVQEILQQTNE